MEGTAMRGLILAAGRGSRMGSRCADQPKGLSELGGRSLVDWQLAAFAAAGIDEVAIVTGHARACFAGRGTRHFHNAQWATTNMVWSMLQAEGWLESGPCLVTYSDIVFDAHAPWLLRQSDADLAMTYHTRWRSVWEARFDDPTSDAEDFQIDDHGRVTAIGGRISDLQQAVGQYMGLLKFTAQGFRQFKTSVAELDAGRQHSIDMTSALDLLISNGHEIAGVAFDGTFCEVDSESDLELYEARRWFPAMDTPVAGLWPAASEG